MCHKIMRDHKKSQDARGSSGGRGTIRFTVGRSAFQTLCKRLKFVDIVLRGYPGVTVCQLSPDLPKVRTFDSHFLKDARELFP
jgi:hypothetical protein